jgi:hypothetical protein
VAIDPDIAVFYSTDVFGTTASYTHSGTTTSIVVIFNRAGALVTVGGAEVQTAAPTARCKASDVSAAVRGDTLVISAVTYYVMRPEPINNEEVLLYLSKDN